MIEALIAAGAAIIGGVLSLIGVMITNSKSNSKMQGKMETSQAVFNEKMNELTREVRMHNDFAIRIPLLEEKIKAANKRISALEEFHKPNN